MVEVGDRPNSRRQATAEGYIEIGVEQLEQVLSGNTKKGDVLAVARVAAIQAAKRTWELIPLCHQIALSGIEVAITATPKRNALRIEVTSRTTASTGAVTVRKDAGSVGHIKQY